ncbi:hypothetical protein BDL97_05G054500 [Sphagnum fallax]|nr:hypothetical protein BDL97_05G054500 [Sphagnum fallax]
MDISTSTTTKCRLNTSIQSSFGVPDDPDYVFAIAPNGDNSAMAVSLSTNVIKLYAPSTGQFLGDCLGHSTTISEIAYPDASAPYFLCSSSADGTVRAWDTRVRKQVAMLMAPLSQELWSFSLGGGSGNVVAAGANAQVAFHPTKKEKLVSASVDGLMCIFDTKGDINDDEGMEFVMSVGTSVSRIGFYGRSQEKLWCLTHIESLSIWNFEEAMIEADFCDTRAKASCNWTLPPVDYLIHCHYAAAVDSLWLVAGTQEGTVGYFPLTYSDGRGSVSVGMIGTSSAVLEGGHMGVVRSVWSPHDGHPSMHGGLEGLFCWTGGEDGRLCSWTENPSNLDISSAWVSSGLVRRRPSRCKQRHMPYRYKSEKEKSSD